MITTSYLLYLMACSAVCLLTFVGWCEILRKRLPFFSGPAQGFVAFLAVNQIAALPFMLLHLPFDWFYGLFLGINAPVAALGVVRSYVRLRAHKRTKQYGVVMLAAISLVVMATVTLLSQYYVKYDADDSFYVSLVEQNKTDANLYSKDPSTGNDSYPLPGIYALESWELLVASISKTAHLTSLETAHGLLPMLVIPLGFMAAYTLLKSYLKTKYATATALGFYGVYLLFGSESRYSVGTFLMARPWLGKAIIAGVIIPLLLQLLMQLYHQPRDKRLLIALSALGLAGLALNPAATFILLAAASCFGLMSTIRWRSLEPGLWLLVALLPLLAGGAYAVLAARSYDSGAEGIQPIVTYDWAHYKKVVGEFMIGAWGYAGIYSIGMFFAVRQNRKLVPLFVVFPVVMLLTYLNPVFNSLVHNYVTGSVFWRLLWLMPIGFGLAIIGSAAFERAKDHVTATTLRVSLFSVLLLLLALPGQFFYDTSKPLFAADTTRSKIPAGTYQTANFIQSLPGDLRIVAPEDAAAFYHTVTTRHTLLFARAIYIPFHYAKDRPTYDTVMRLYDWLNETGAPVNKSQGLFLLKTFDIDIVVVTSSSNAHADLLSETDWQQIHSNEHYAVFQKSANP